MNLEQEPCYDNEMRSTFETQYEDYLMSMKYLTIKNQTNEK